MKRKFLLLLCAGALTVSTLASCGILAHEHTVAHVEAKEATCQATGNVEYWHCTDCGEAWSDEALTTAITAEQKVVEKLAHEYENACDTHCKNCEELTNADAAHTLTHTEGNAATCQAAGNIEYWTCSDCNGAWSDEALTTAIDVANVGIPALDHSYVYACDKVCESCNEETNPNATHTLTHVAAVAATCQATGNIEYWTCSDCNGAWSDEALTQVTNAMSVVIPMEAHEYEYACDAFCKNCNEETNPEAAHALTHTAAKDASCQATGNIEYWTCSSCNGMWSDEALTQMTNAMSVVIPMADHSYFYACDKVCQNCYEETNPNATHDVAHVAAKDATCKETGNIEYWFCNDCGSAWSDEALTQMTNKMMATIPMLDHSYFYACDKVCQNCYEETNPDATHTTTHVAAKDATCQATGNIEYWVCSDCSCAWSDEALTQMTNAMSVVIPMTDHSYFYACDKVCENCYQETNPNATHSVTHVAAKDATCTENGNIEYWVCSDCSCAWSDEALTQMTNAMSVVVPMIDHYGYDADFVCDGCSTVIEPEDGETLTFAQAKVLGLAVGEGKYTSKKYYVTGYITDVYNTMYGNMYLVDDNGVEYTVYGTYSTDGSTRYDALSYKPVKGDEVTVYGIVGNYYGAPQMKNGWLDEIVQHVECVWEDATCLEAKHCIYCGKVEGDVADHTYVDGTCSVCGALEENATLETTTVNVVIKDYAVANGWTNSTQYNTLKMDDNITVTAKKTTGNNNTGKYYTSGYEWRTYQNEAPAITVTAAEGKTIISVKITYNINKTGILTLNSENITSGTVVAVNANSITFGVGNTNSSVTNGQVKITAIEVVYA